jgi:hypothetical protein
VTPDDFPNHGSYMTYVTMCEKALEEEIHGSSTEELYEVSCTTFENDGLVFSWHKGSKTALHHTSPMFTIKNDNHDDNFNQCVLCTPEKYFVGTPEEAHKRWLECNDAGIARDYETFFVNQGWPVPPYKPDENGAHP